jgi:tetratricopeptide (TPR) repeat protein
VPRPAGPAIAVGVTGAELDKSVSRELTTLRAEAAEQAAKHLVMAARLLDEDPELAHAHALAARKCGPRVAVIREAVGLAAYAAGRWAEALAELRAARRISGDDEHWPVMADCERALGRPERTLQMAAAPEVAKLSRAAAIEMRMVVAGARADLDQLDAAVVTLQTPDLQNAAAPWAPRLRFAYAAALQAAGRHDEARQWYERAAEVDPEGETGAAERLLELDGVRFLDEDEEA